MARPYVFYVETQTEMKSKVWCGMGSMCEGLGTYWSCFNTSWSFNCSAWDWPSPWLRFTEEGQFYRYSFSPWLLMLVPYCFQKAISYSRTDVKIMETWLGMGEQVMDACSACLQQRTVFTQQVLAKVLNQLVWSCTCVWCLGSQKSLNGDWSASSFVLMGILTFCTLLFLCYMKTLTHSDSLCACLGQCLNCLDSSSIWLLVC